jgi:hypothetical protein
MDATYTYMYASVSYYEDLLAHLEEQGLALEGSIDMPMEASVTVTVI